MNNTDFFLFFLLVLFHSSTKETGLPSVVQYQHCCCGYHSRRFCGISHRRRYVLLLRQFVRRPDVRLRAMLRENGTVKERRN